MNLSLRTNTLYQMFKSLTTEQRQELILNKMKAKGIEVRSGVPEKKYESKEFYELIHIANCFPELREKCTVNN